jgi:hypothetical protein
MKSTINQIYTALHQLKDHKWRQLGLLLAVQGLLMLVGFNKVITHPEQITFVNNWDGVKNYYTYNWYVNQPDTVEYRFFTGMNHPYGDYSYYTDNTPIVAATVRWVHLNVVNLEGHFTAVFHWVIFVGIWLSTIALFFILRKLGLPALWVFLGSLCLVWVHPQIFRYALGSSNLGYSWTLLLVLLSLLHLHDQLMNRAVRGTLLWSLAIVLVIIAAAFSHLYFLAMLLLWVGFFLAGHCIYGLLKRRIPWLPMLSGILVAGVSATVVFGLIQFTDGYYDFRLVTNDGYGVSGWVLHFTDMFASYSFNSFQFIFNVKFSEGLESHSYWGAGALYGYLMLLVWGIYKSYQKRQWPSLKVSTSIGFFWLFMIISALLLLFIALPEHIPLGGKRSMFNFLSLFSYLKHIYPRITQFRSLGRFVWPLVWVVNIFLLWYLAHKRAKVPAFVPIIVFLLMMVDVSDRLKFYNNIFTPNPFSTSQLKEATEEFDAVDPARYQAILPIPFYHVGSDNFKITMDPSEEIARESMQFSMAWKLPMMACQLARTAEYQALNLTGMFQGRGIDADMVKLMDDRPVLIMVRKQSSSPCLDSNILPEGWEIDICALPVVIETTRYKLYEWWPK